MLEGPDSRRWGTCRLRRVSSVGLLSTFFFFFQAHRRGAVKSVLVQAPCEEAAAAGECARRTFPANDRASRFLHFFLKALLRLRRWGARTLPQPVLDCLESDRDPQSRRIS